MEIYNSDKNEFMSIYDNLLTYNDEFFVLKDFDAYVNAQDKIDRLYREEKMAKNVWYKYC